MSMIKKGFLIKKGSEYLPDLPEEIMMQILQLLPMDSILALKCLSKQWNNLIRDPKFYNLYHTNAMVLFIFDETVYCVLFKHHNNCTKNISKGVLPPYILHPLPFRFGAACHCPELLSGWSNGLACVIIHGPIARFDFYNLLTQTFFAVADAPKQPWLYYGFGYDRQADDHKILVVPRYKKDVDDQNEDSSKFWVYSYKNSGWKSFEGFPYDAYTYDDRPSKPFCGAYAFNGVLHAVAIIAGESSKEKKRAMKMETPRLLAILTFDLHTCRFGRITVPCGRRLPVVCKFAELDGRLCFMTKEGTTLEVWVMKEYGVVESWTELFSVSFHLSFHLHMHRLAYAKLYDTGDGTKKVLLAFHHNLELFCYDLNTNKMEKTVWCDFNKNMITKWV